MGVYIHSNPIYKNFSNFSPTSISINGFVWKSVEHFFQASKTLNLKLQQQIRSCPTPRDARRLGRTVPLRPDWEQVKYRIMIEALKAKFTSHKDLRKLLLDTKDEMIYEDSWWDSEWGTGEKGSVGEGKNLLGKALMEVRAILGAYYRSKDL